MPSLGVWLAALLALQAAPPASSLAAQLKAQVEREQRYPERSYRGGQTGIVEIIFEIDDRGMPADIRVSTSSGWRMLDEAAVQAVRRFRPLTGGVVGQRVTLLLQYAIAQEPGAPEARSALRRAVARVRQSRDAPLDEIIQPAP